MRPFLIALQFLTILPVKIASNIEKKDFGRSLFWFPVVGLFIGLVLSLSIFLFEVLPQLAIAAIIIIASVVVTGGIHLDGFADTCDGLYGFTTKERALQIMRDSRIGTFAAAGIILLLILKFSLLASFSQGAIWKYLILAAVFARWAQVLSCSISGYAREDGKAKYFIEYASPNSAISGGIFTLVLFMILLKLEGLILFFLSLILALISIKFIRNRLGGMTGDTIGAVNEISEITVLLFGLVLSKAII